MGSILKRSGSPFFYARFTVDGREKWISTKKTDRKEARVIADAYENAARGDSSVDDQFNVLLKLLAAIPPGQQDTKRSEYSARLMRHRTISLPIVEAWPAWLDSPLKGNPGAITISGYDSIWRRFAAWISKHKLEHLHEVTPLHAQGYAADVWRSHVAPATYNKHVMFLRGMFNTLKAKAGLIVNPWADVKSLDKETQGRQNFTPEELKTICLKARGATRFMVALGLYTGARLGDVISLRWADIGRDKIEIIPMKTKRKGKQITLPIHPVLRRLLNELRKQTGSGEYLFPAEHNSYQQDGSAVSKRFQQFLNDCGIKTQEEGNGHRRHAIVRKGFHSLRHSFVSLCAANRVPQVAIQELVGHGSPAMTALYSHADFEQKQSAINALPAMGFESNKQKGRIKTCRIKQT